ncbi:LIVCS family branched-chain amino acid:cation transporter [Mesocricetibacter intestinalis]|uniref:Branched-chain amino acid transport system carrier protein n=1 Tax=Mesocricetibacter intestinalis TaxID=1521930 RepID=A0A4R6VCJ7_9PAST|nr:branched-chain amino acid transport system II carrier protein [Mesocricetibacter intestinalis]TDQ59566.1 LIVCS family branched-chain amino acid:cation transporter [Mesocricetibacter intestinalis]
MNKNTLIIGFTLFAIFFGAGNLIFPPRLGLESGEDFFLSITGFILSGVGLPLLGIVVSGFYEGGYKNALNKIHPWFSVGFLMAIYLTIGPFFAIPRTAATSYEMSILPFLNGPSTISLLIFSAIYFIISLWLSINPSKSVERIGAILTPLLLLAILILVVKAFILLSDNAPNMIAVQDNANASPFFTGFINGYLTMDAIASIAFSVIVIAAIKSKGTKNGTDLTKQTIFSGIIAAIALGAIYLAIGWIGNRIPMTEETLLHLKNQNLDIGTYILNSITSQAFGDLGRSVIGFIVMLACLTTSIGLIVSVSEYFNELYHKISYKTYVVIFTLISFVISNQGLSFVISKSVPMLMVLYPIAMTVIFLLLINLFIPLPQIVQRTSVGFTLIIAILSVAEVSFVQNIPLKQYSLEWLLFAVAGAVIGYIFYLLSAKKA